jgi:predicted TIM-barrel fold metal-dependent hydrolase
MIIDFHTHIFPDKIAEKTIRALEQEGNITAFTGGTLDELKSSMQENNITKSVVLPVVTRPSQFASVNHFASEINGKDGIISFGGIHPDMEDYRERLEEIKEMGLLGIKLHPDYQETFVDDPKMIRIIEYAVELGLIVLLHAGLDIGLPNPVHCTPPRTANMLSQIGKEDAKIVLAHMGGFAMWNEVEEYLVGKQIWIDTSYSLDFIKEEQFVRIVRDHGADRVLFATDSPWGGQGETLVNLKKMKLTEEEFDRILYMNAAQLLGLE